MYIDILRFLAIVILLLIIAINNYPYIEIIKNASVQFIIAIFCITILLLVDNITGFILILAVLVLYFKLFNKLLIKKNNTPYTLYESDPNNNIYESIYEKVNYTTDKNLVDAQNNIVDIENYNSEIKIIESKEKMLYSTQGLDVGSVKGYNRDELSIESNLIQ
jgi:Ca2+/Na+ antiporter